jgi:hypothetical protein
MDRGSRSDATITLKVKAALTEEKLIKGRDISVRTDHSVVDLAGTVNSKGVFVVASISLALWQLGLKIKNRP